jgi:hypothetical protein
MDTVTEIIISASVKSARSSAFFICYSAGGNSDIKSALNPDSASCNTTRLLWLQWRLYDTGFRLAPE